MLHITIPKGELFDETNGRFYETKETKLTLEHSLISLSKWEANWCTAYLSKSKKTAEQCLDYIKCMTLTPNVDPLVYLAIPPSVLEQINSYVERPMTATTFTEAPGTAKHSNKPLTAEVIYYLMIAYNIPFECQKWHLNRLLTLIRVCEIKNKPQKKMSPSTILARNSELNKARRAAMNTKG